MVPDQALCRACVRITYRYLTTLETPSINSSIEESLSGFHCRLLFDEPMSAHTSYKIGGPADVYAVPDDILDLQMLLTWLHEHSVPVFILGGGTNLLVSDKGIRGAVIQLGKGFDRIHIRGAEVSAGAAVNISRLLRKTIGSGLAGLEGLAGVPGTVGGAVYMNAGTRHGYISDALTCLTAVDLKGGLLSLTKDELGLEYRKSKVPELGIIVAGAQFSLTKAEPHVINEVVQSRVDRRKQTQPPGIGTCGSVFKNPPGEHAAQFLESIGAKGMQIGGARVSSKHANFIQNTGVAKASDVKALMEELRAIVEEKCGVALEPEVQMVGEW